MADCLRVHNTSTFLCRRQHLRDRRLQWSAAEGRGDVQLGNGHVDSVDQHVEGADVHGRRDSEQQDLRDGRSVFVTHHHLSTSWPFSILPLLIVTELIGVTQHRCSYNITFRSHNKPISATFNECTPVARYKYHGKPMHVTLETCLMFFCNIVHKTRQNHWFQTKLVSHVVSY